MTTYTFSYSSVYVCLGLVDVGVSQILLLLPLSHSLSLSYHEATGYRVGSRVLRSENKNKLITRDRLTKKEGRGEEAEKCRHVPKCVICI